MTLVTHATWQLHNLVINATTRAQLGIQKIGIHDWSKKETYIVDIAEPHAKIEFSAAMIWPITLRTFVTFSVRAGRLFERIACVCFIQSSCSILLYQFQLMQLYLTVLHTV